MTRINEIFGSCKRDKFRSGIFISLVLIYIYVFSLAFQNSINIYVMINEVLCASVAFSIGLICFLNRDLKSGRFYKNVGAGFLVISVVSFIYIFINRQYILDNSSFYINDNLGKANYYLEYLIILMAYMIEKIHKKVDYEILIGIKVPAGVMLFSFIYFVAGRVQHFDIISKVILGGVLTLDILIIHINKLKLKKEEIDMLYLYIFLISVYQYIGSRYYLLKDAGVIISLSIKFLSYYIMFLSISRSVIKESYKVMKGELTKVQVAQRQLNDILKSRNKTLVELEHIIKKNSEKYIDLMEQISDGIVIFYFNKIYYMNSEARKSLSISDDLKKVTFDKFSEIILAKSTIIEKEEFVKKKC